jgi:hypothetical protein
MWIPFYVICNSCGYRNKADYVVATSFRMVLRGEFTTCRNPKCKRHFVRIEVPGRRGVRNEMKEMAKEGVPLPSHISIYDVSGEPMLMENACARGVT